MLSAVTVTSPEPTPSPSSDGVTNHPAAWSVLLPVMALIIALSSVHNAPARPFLRGDETPYGYTLSLALFAIPVTSLMMWFAPRRRMLVDQWRAFWITSAIIAVTWSMLDIFLGNSFFRFPNHGATLGIFVSGYTFGVGWQRTIPVEEFAFYILGSSSVLLGYIWASETWLSAYTLSYDQWAARAQRIPRLITFRPRAMVVAVVTFVLALLWKKYGWHQDHNGFPGYFLFELAMVVVPAAILSDVLTPLINPPAYVHKSITLVLTSLLWEVTLAMPYGWWDFNHDNMMGIVVHPWYNLPIEEVILWPTAAWINVMMFQAIRVYLRSGRPLWDVLFVGHDTTSAG